MTSLYQRKLLSPATSRNDKYLRKTPATRLFTFPGFQLARISPWSGQTGRISISVPFFSGEFEGLFRDKPQHVTISHEAREIEHGEWRHTPARLLVLSDQADLVQKQMLLAG
ncbi:hypothetical protein PABG_11279 [Paracoccidioides brasiliensis Pb03]|nr:hypothetical protein PABG_11279 [Paracoccidioides brasiliensis Pb03]